MAMQTALKVGIDKLAKDIGHAKPPDALVWCCTPWKCYNDTKCTVRQTTGLVKEAMVTRSVPTLSEAVRRQSYLEKKSGNSYKLKAMGNS